MMILFLASVGISFGQTKEEVDQRLVENKGEEIYNILSYRKDYYKFLLWELTNAYEIVNSSSVSDQNILSISTIIDKSNNQFLISNLDNSQTFNFIKYNFMREKDSDVYYDLGNGSILKFTGLLVLWEEFRNSGLNNKQ